TPLPTLSLHDTLPISTASFGASSSGRTAAKPAATPAASAAAAPATAAANSAFGARHSQNTATLSSRAFRAACPRAASAPRQKVRSEEHTSELQSLDHV